MQMHQPSLWLVAAWCAGAAAAGLPHGHCLRSCALPSSIGVSKVSAAYRGGVLGITFPRREGATPKQIVEVM